jgi:uncharacterized membrane protein
MSQVGNPIGVEVLNGSFFTNLFTKLSSKNIYIDFVGFSGFFLFLIGFILLLINSFMKNNNDNDDKKMKDKQNAMIVTYTGMSLFIIAFMAARI